MKYNPELARNWALWCYDTFFRFSWAEKNITRENGRDNFYTALDPDHIMIYLNTRVHTRMTRAGIRKERDDDGL